MGRVEEDQASPAELASETLQKIQRYAESESPKESLIALNVLVAILILGLVFTSWIFEGGQIYSIEFFAVLALSLVFSAVIGLGYFRLIETIAGFSDDQANGLRLSIIVELITAPVALAGLLFQIPFLIQAAFVLLLVQVFTPLAGQFVQISHFEESSEPSEDLIWTGLGKTADLITVGSFLANILIIILWYIQ